MVYPILFESSTGAVFEIVWDLVNSVLKLCGMFKLIYLYLYL